MYSKKIVIAILFASLFSLKSFSQFTASWAFTSTNTGVKTGSQQAAIAIADAVIGDTLSGNVSYSNTTGVSLSKSSTSNTWPLVPTNGWNIDFPLTPVTGNDVTIQSFSFSASTSNGNSSQQMLAQLAYQKDGSGSYIFVGSPVTISSGNTVTLYNYPAFTQKLYDGHNYKIRVFIYALTANISSKTLKIKSAVFNGIANTAGTQPSVTTTSATKTGKYTGLATGVVTAGTLLVSESGVVWDIAANPTVALTTKNASGPNVSGNIGAGNGGNIAGLSTSTTYNTRAYVISESGDVFYGSNLTFTTDAPSVASLTTNAASGITSIKSISGGVILDSGGVGITAKGICWNTATNPDISLPTKTNDGIGNTNFSSTLKILVPSTTYYARAFATNSIGTAYGNEVSFTTLAPQPVIITITGNSANAIPFGSVIVNNISGVKSYSLTASALTPLVGNITITAPAGFEISLSPGTGFGSTLNVPYTSGSIAATIIYVRFLPNQFGDFAGTITHTGGGATTINIDDVSVTGKGIQNPGDFSNTGTDFWVGYGFQALMTGSNNQEMVLYISAKQDAIVTVEIGKPTDANYYTQTYNVVANTATVSFTLPKNGTQDCRLNSTGVLPRGIHVYSNNIPFALWGHIYASSSSGATLVLPTNTWGSNYSVLTVGGETNSGVPHSFFFVQAAEDGTIVDIVPSADITATASGTTVKYAAGTPFSVTLNKGDVFNALGKLLTSKIGVDLTGTTVVSRDCNKKIALFTGNGRVELKVGGCSSGGGSDNFLQQMFPKQAWGTKYLTTPFRDMEAGIYKIIVSDPATVVSVNGSVLTTGFSQNAYTLETDTLLSIVSDKPVMVAQFCVTNRCNGTGIPTHPNTGDNGDPEMIIVSPVQQAINDVAVYSSNNYNILHNYINVIIPNAGVASFMFDGVNASTAFSTHTADANYSYAVFSDLVGNTSHRLQSDVAFNAIAYGYSNTGNNESYGYNAGTNIKSLSQYLSVQNPYANITSDSIISACLNNDFKYTVSLPYKPFSMKWDFFNNTVQQPSSDTILVTNPIPVDSSIISGVKLFKYSLPTTYKFTSTGSFPVNITVNATNADGCTGVQTITFSVKVVNPPTANFNVVFNGCPFDFANFSDLSTSSGYNVVGWEWNFGGSFPPNTSTMQNPTSTYPSAGTYNVTLRAINTIGCFKDTTKPFTIQPGPIVTSVVADNNGPDCAGRKITFTTTASTSLGTIVKWYWEYSDGKKDTTTANSVTHSFATAAAYTIKVFVETNNGCRSTQFTFNQMIYKVVADFTFATPKCINDLVTFTDVSTGKVTNATIDTKFKWSFGDAANSTSTTNPSTFTYTTAGTYTVKLKTSLIYALATEFCADSTTKQIVINDKLAKPVVTLDATKTTTTSLTFNWAAITGATSYQVSTNGGATWSNPSSGATGTTHILTALTPNTVYSLCVKVLGNCPSDSACISGKTLTPTLNIFVPNVFTPNGQGAATNDKLIMCINNVKSIRFAIFNQWGEKLFETSNPTLNAALGCYEVWDGNAQGKQQPTGVYVYAASIIYNDGKSESKKGTVNLIR